MRPRDQYDRLLTDFRVLDAERTRLLQAVALVEGKLHVLVDKLHSARPTVGSEAPAATSNGGDSDGDSKGSKLLEILTEEPRLNVKTAAMTIYGANGREECQRVRALLRHLKKRDKVHSGQRGVWQVGPEPEGEPEAQKAPPTTNAPRGGIAFKIPNRTPNGAAR